MSNLEHKNLAYRDLIIDPNRREVYLKGELVILSALEFDLLYCLASKPGRAWKRTELLEKVWGYQDDSSEGGRVIDVHIGQIRKKIEQKFAGIEVKAAHVENWSTEYGDLEINVAVVNSVDDASEHIAKYGTQHTEAIVTENNEVAKRFIALSDCAAVMVNTSTRFTDGEQMGFGAEIGISNQKLHARGPMGLEAMTTTTWIVTGNGQIRS